MANAPTSLEDVISKDDLESRYINEHFCGSGAFGNVHKFGIKPQFAKTAQHKRIAVKTNKDEDRGADREIQSLVTLLDEPHIVNLISYSRSPSLIVMECCACDLDSYIKQKRFDISLKDLLKFWNEALHSLKSLKEKGILHRDVKPNNFLVDFRGTDGSNVQLVTFKLGDFGCGRKINKGRMDRGEIDDLTKNLGTNGFISPEIAPLLGKDDSSGAYTYQSDLWSLSVVVFYIASRGKKPFTVQRLLSLHQEINTDSKRNSDIKAIVGEHLVDSFSSIFSILVETLKWSPVERYTAEKCLHIVEHLQKQDDHSALVQKPLVVRPAAAISTPDEEKKKQMKKEQEREENQLENIGVNETAAASYIKMSCGVIIGSIVIAGIAYYYYKGGGRSGGVRLQFQKVPIHAIGRLATVAEVRANLSQVMGLFERWTIALLEGGKVDGPGYGGKVQEGDFKKQCGEKIIVV